MNRGYFHEPDEIKLRLSNESCPPRGGWNRRREVLEEFLFAHFKILVFLTIPRYINMRGGEGDLCGGIAVIYQNEH